MDLVLKTILVALFLSVHSVPIHRECFPPSERLFTAPVTNPPLPQVRLIQGSWGSWRAAQYTAYLVLREQMGLNVTFYPDIDPNIYKRQPPKPKYPQYLFEWIRTDKVDFILESWPVAWSTWPASQTYVDNGSVVFGGPNGEYGEIGWFIPKYLSDENPGAIVPVYLKTNQTLRNLLRSASNDTTNNGINWLEKMVMKANNSWSYDNPLTNDWPIVWGSSPTYAMSNYSGKLVENLLGGMNVNYVTWGNEGDLSAMMLDMYQRRLPFIANLYTPHSDFNTFLNGSSGPIMEFVRIALPWNPSNLVSDPCFTQATCDNPTEALLKTANPRLEKRLPEMLKFFRDYSIPATQVNGILGTVNDMMKQNSSKNLGYTATQIWYNATCKWARSSEGNKTWRAWALSINRTECPTKCGVEVTSKSKQKIFVGARCDTIIGKCECLSPLVEGIECNSLCRGAILSSNDSLVLCSGRGTCNKVSHRCSCDQGFGGDGCETAFVKARVSTRGIATTVAIATLCCVIAIGFSVWMRYNMSYHTIRALSPNLTSVMNVGVVFFSISAILVLMPASPATCVSWIWMTGLGIVLTVVTPMVKAYRVQRVFTQLQVIDIPDKQLMWLVARFTLAQIILCVIWTGVFFGLATDKTTFLGRNYNKKTLTIESLCQNSDAYFNVYLTNILFWAILTAVLLFFTYKTRVAPGTFKETQCTYFAIFIGVVMTIATVIGYSVFDEQNVQVGVHSAGILLVVGVILLTFYGKRAHSFYMEPERRNEMVDWAVLHKRLQQKFEYEQNQKKKREEKMRAKRDAESGWGVSGLMLGHKDSNVTSQSDATATHSELPSEKTTTTSGASHS